MASGAAQLRGWGRLPGPGREVASEDLASIVAGVPLTRGLGRSYGDASLPPSDHPVAASSLFADRVLEFEPTSGLLIAEAGFTLAELNRLFLARGWTSPVSPGTEHVTLGGMVAADVHGKNHHQAGTIGRHVSGLVLRLASGDVVRCGPGERADLFDATVGGMGLTGHLIEVTLRLSPVPTPWVRFTSSRHGSLEELVAALDEASSWPFTAAWLDGLGGTGRCGRGILLRGRWAEDAPREVARHPTPQRVPVDAPGWLLNRLSVGAFNLLYYRKHLRREHRGLATPWSFFYPLDVLDDWNRLYGRRGLTQYQCVLPREVGGEGLIGFLRFLRARGGQPYLIVLKDFGDEGRGLLSFPRPGYTLALDFPVDSALPALVDRLNERLLELGGRVYLAKDAFTRREHFRRMEPRLPAFEAVRDAYDPERRLGSALSRRLLENAE